MLTLYKSMVHQHLEYYVHLGLLIVKGYSRAGIYWFCVLLRL